MEEECHNVCKCDGFDPGMLTGKKEEHLSPVPISGKGQYFHVV